MGEVEADIHACVVLLEAADACVDNEPGGEDVGASFIEDEVALLGWDAEAHGGEFELDAFVEGAVGELALLGDAEAFGLDDDGERDESWVDEFDAALGHLGGVLGDDRTDRLSVAEGEEKESKQDDCRHPVCCARVRGGDMQRHGVPSFCVEC